MVIYYVQEMEIYVLKASFVLVISVSVTYTELVISVSASLTYVPQGTEIDVAKGTLTYDEREIVISDALGNELCNALGKEICVAKEISIFALSEICAMETEIAEQRDAYEVVENDVFRGKQSDFLMVVPQNCFLTSAVHCNQIKD